MHTLLDKIKGDKVIWMIVVILSLCSMLAVYSSTGTLAYKYQAGNTEYYIFKHMAIIVFALLFMYGAHLIDYRYYAKISLILLVVSLPLLIFTLFSGTDINEARRWITLPVLNYTFQTSDLARLALIVYVARFLSKKQTEEQDFYRTFLPLIIPVVVICALIAPADFSTAGLLMVTCLLLMFIGRVKFKYLLLLAGGVVVLFGLYLGVSHFTGNQGRITTWQHRVETFVSGEGETYQNRQAKIAIAKGGLLGKGPGKSTQRNFLPHPYSDFIYAIVIEEYGLIGGIVLVLLYLLFLFRCIKIVIKTPKAFGALLAVGLSFSLVLQAMVNMAVAVHLVPVTGLPLPLVSMGGTSMIFTSISIGIILSVSRNTEEREANTETEIPGDVAAAA